MGEGVGEVEAGLEVVGESLVVWGVAVCDGRLVVDDIAFLSSTMIFSALRKRAVSASVERPRPSGPSFIAACWFGRFAARLSGLEVEVFSSVSSLGVGRGMSFWALLFSRSSTAGALFSDSAFRTASDTRPFSSVIFPDKTGSSIVAILSLALRCTTGWARSLGTTMPPLLLETGFWFLMGIAMPLLVSVNATSNKTALTIKIITQSERGELEEGKAFEMRICLGR